MALPAQADSPSFAWTGARLAVYIEPATNQAEAQLDPRQLDTALADALTQRKSMIFTLVDRRQDADCTIHAQIRRYEYREQDPVDMIMGWGAVAMDAMKKEPYATTVISVTVTPNGGQRPWQDEIRGTVTQQGMTEAEAPARAFAKAAARFITTYFHSGLYRDHLGL